MEKTLLGTNGSLKGTFAALLDAKRTASLQLLNGKFVSGLVIGYPTDEYVIIQDNPSTTISGTCRRLVSCASISS